MSRLLLIPLFTLVMAVSLMFAPSVVAQNTAADLDDEHSQQARPYGMAGRSNDQPVLFQSPIPTPGSTRADETLSGATAHVPLVGSPAQLGNTIMPAVAGKRVGIQAGHSQMDSGAVCPDGTNEVTVNEAVANKAADLLRAQGVIVDVLPGNATYTHNYEADVFIALHADQCKAVYSGYKVSRWQGKPGTGLRDSGDASDAWVRSLWQAFGSATGLPKDTEPGHFAPCMREYYALNPIEGGRICTGHPTADAEKWTQIHGITDSTPGAIIELGWLSGDHDFLFSEEGQQRMATGIADAAVQFFGGQAVIDIADPDAYRCNLPGHIDFENYPNLTDLTSGTVAGIQFMTTGGYTWIVGDWSTGLYNGKYPAGGGYTSGGDHWAWLGPTQGEGRIVFPKGPASSFSLLVSANTPVTLDAYDATDNLLASAGPAPKTYNTGHMTELRIIRSSAEMAYVVVHDTGDYFLIDEVCTNAPGTPDTIKRIVDQSYRMETGQKVRGSFWSNFVAGFQRYLNIIIGPFFSDVELVLTRPDGSIVRSTDPGVKITKTPNVIEVSIENAAEGEWNYEINAIELEPGGEDIRVVVDEQLIMPTNSPPVAGIGGPYAAPEGHSITFNGSDSSDLNGDAITYAWDFGDSAGTEGISPTHTYADNGVYTVTLTVTDAAGANNTRTVTATVDNIAPQVEIAGNPVSQAGESIAVHISFSDPGFDSALAGTAESFSAAIDWGDGQVSPVSVVETSDPTGSMGTGDGSHIYSTAGDYRVEACVVDDDGGTSCTSLPVSVSVKPSNLYLPSLSNP